MKLLLTLFLFIAPFTGKAQKNRVKVLPHTLTKVPWLTPAEGILVTEHTLFHFAIKNNTDTNEVKFTKIPRMMEMVGEHLLREEKYRNASAENINNPNHYRIANSTVPTSVPGQWPEILYPEILVVVAHDLFQKLGSDLMKTIPYILAFWNGVDMMYRSIENPKIRLHIVGIILETEYGVFEYLMDEYEQKQMVTGHALYKARKFWHKHRDQIPLESYDDVVAMTTRPICQSLHGACGSSAIGQAWISSMCSDDSANERTLKVSIFQDNGKFSGIPVVSHELGHALGMHHDDDQMFKSEEELKDLPNCRNVNRDHIMASTVSSSAYERRWSPCSIEQLEKFIKTKNATCLYNPPVPGEVHFPRLLPGKLVSLDEQCQAAGYDAFSDVEFQPCQQIKCKMFNDSNHSYDSSLLVGLEGTPCNKDYPDDFCMFGECISEAEFV